MEILAVIPARGGSKSVKNKNIKLLDGKPLIAHTIEQAKNSKLITRVIVSTDSKEIADISKKNNAEIPFLRPSELAQDETPMLPVLKHLIEELKKQNYSPDLIVLLQPTSPFRTSSSIDLAINKLIKTNADSVVSLTHLDHHYSWSTELDSEERVNFPKAPLQRQHSKKYFLDGAIFVVKTSILMKQDRFIIGEDTRAIVLDKKESFQIDDEIDFYTAQEIIKNKNAQNKNTK